MAFAYIFIGDYEHARQHDQNMQKLCPFKPGWSYLAGAQLEQFAGNLDQAIALYQQGVKVEPDSPLCRFFLIHAMLENGDEPNARIIADQIRTLDNRVTGRGLVRAFSLDKSTRDRFEASLTKFDLF